MTLCMMACKQAAELETYLRRCCIASSIMQQEYSNASTGGPQQQLHTQPACFRGRILQRLLQQQAARRQLHSLC